MLKDEAKVAKNKETLTKKQNTLKDGTKLIEEKRFQLVIITLDVRVDPTEMVLFI